MMTVIEPNSKNSLQLKKRKLMFQSTEVEGMWTPIIWRSGKRRGGGRAGGAGESGRVQQERGQGHVAHFYTAGFLQERALLL